MVDGASETLVDGKVGFDRVMSVILEIQQSLDSLAVAVGYERKPRPDQSSSAGKFPTLKDIGPSNKKLVEGLEVLEDRMDLIKNLLLDTQKIIDGNPLQELDKGDNQIKKIDTWDRDISVVLDKMEWLENVVIHAQQNIIEILRHLHDTSISELSYRLSTLHSFTQKAIDNELKNRDLLVDNRQTNEKSSDTLISLDGIYSALENFGVKLAETSSSATWPEGGEQDRSGDSMYAEEYVQDGPSDRSNRPLKVGYLMPEYRDFQTSARAAARQYVLGKSRVLEVKRLERKLYDLQQDYTALHQDVVTFSQSLVQSNHTFFSYTEGVGDNYRGQLNCVRKLLSSIKFYSEFASLSKRELSFFFGGLVFQRLDAIRKKLDDASNKFEPSPQKLYKEHLSECMSNSKRSLEFCEKLVAFFESNIKDLDSLVWLLSEPENGEPCDRLLQARVYSWLFSVEFLFIFTAYKGGVSQESRDFFIRVTPDNLVVSHLSKSRECLRWSAFCSESLNSDPVILMKIESDGTSIVRVVSQQVAAGLVSRSDIQSFVSLRQLCIDGFDNLRPRRRNFTQVVSHEQLKSYLEEYDVDGWTLFDVEGNGNCFYLATADQLRRIGHPLLRSLQEGTELHTLLRYRAQGRDFEDYQWADYYDMMELAKSLDLVFAIAFVSHLESGFRYYYYEADSRGNVQPRETRDENDLPKHKPTIIRLAYTGNHYLSVLSTKKENSLLRSLPPAPPPMPTAPTGAAFGYDRPPIDPYGAMPSTETLRKIQIQILEPGVPGYSESDCDKGYGPISMGGEQHGSHPDGQKQDSPYGVMPVAGLSPREEQHARPCRGVRSDKQQKQKLGHYVAARPSQGGIMSKQQSAKKERRKTPSSSPAPGKS